MADNIAMYGRVSIPRGYCLDCESSAFVIGGELACCGSPYEVKPKIYKRVSDPCEMARKRPDKEAQNRKLNEQAWLCFYCEQPLGSRVPYLGRELFLRVEFDHMVPLSWMGSSPVDNFVASCHRCNSWKGCMVFDTVEAAKLHLQHRWSKNRCAKPSK